jgi:hypothetical protein
MGRASEPVKLVAKRWGREVWISQQLAYCGKILEICRDKRCSFHFHVPQNRVLFPSDRSS